VVFKPSFTRKVKAFELGCASFLEARCGEIPASGAGRAGGNRCHPAVLHPSLCLQWRGTRGRRVALPGGGGVLRVGDAESGGMLAGLQDPRASGPASASRAGREEPRRALR